MVKDSGKYVKLGDKLLKWDGARVYNVLRNKKHVVSISAYKVPYIPEKTKLSKFLGAIDKKTLTHLSKLGGGYKPESPAIKKKDAELAKWDSFDVSFMASKSMRGVSDEIIKAGLDKKDNRNFKNCKAAYYFRTSNDTGLNSCVTAEISTKGKQGFYYIANLLLEAEADNICHSVSGAEQIYIVEHYFKSLVPGLLIGSLYDGAHNYMNETCKEINRLYANGKLTKELVNTLLRSGSNYDRLSSLTVAKTGLTYYEKFGYMAGVTNMKNSDGPALMELSYAGCFKSFLGKLENRLDILDLKLADILKEHAEEPKTKKPGDRRSMSSNMYGGAKTKKAKTVKVDNASATEKPAEVVKPKYNKRVVKMLATRLPSIKYLLAKLRPDIKFEFVYVRDLYHYMSGEYDRDFYCKDNKQMSLEHALLLYAVVTSNISKLLTNILFSLIDETWFNCVKFARVERTRDHEFILEQHARLPAVKKEYLAEFIGADDNKLVGGGAKKASAGLTCEEREAIRSRVDKIVARIALIK